ncbi:MAG: MerR family transcriptional regulator [Kangiellaceae bacterium]|jgi:DNA-binding transcriptional MerR regulator|nr:MerR family transcriptional regulator [Kangiellaceae bacterium]
MSTENMSFSIGTVARLVGVSTHVLRVWEKRYDLKLATRNEQGRRAYSPSEVDKLKLIKGALDQGYKISDIVNLSVSKLSQLSQVTDATAQANDFSSPAKQTNSRVAILGARLSHMLFKTRSNISYQVVNNFSELNELLARHSGLIKGLLIDMPQMNDELEEVLYNTKLLLGSNKPIVVLNSEPGEATEKRLAEAQITVEKRDINSDILQETLSVLSEQSGQTKPSMPTSALNQQQLQNLLYTDSKVYCECPKHLGDLYHSLSEFIKYTDECEQTSPKDAALHQHIAQNLDQMRNQLTQLIYDVAEVDGIKLN